MKDEITKIISGLTKPRRTTVKELEYNGLMLQIGFMIDMVLFIGFLLCW